MALQRNNGINELIQSTHHPNKWRGIALWDIAAKLISSIIANWLTNHLCIFGMDEQCWLLFGKGCLDATFTLKKVLQQLKEQGKNTHVLFVDQVNSLRGKRVPQPTNKGVLGENNHISINFWTHVLGLEAKNSSRWDQKYSCVELACWTKCCCSDWLLEMADLFLNITQV